MSVPPAFTGMALFGTPRHRERPARGSLASQPIPENSPVMPIQYSTPNMPARFSTPTPRTLTHMSMPITPSKPQVSLAHSNTSQFYLPDSSPILDPQRFITTQYGSTTP